MPLHNGEATLTLTATTPGAPSVTYYNIGANNGRLKSVATQTMAGANTNLAYCALLIGVLNNSVLNLRAKLDEGIVSDGEDLFWTGDMPFAGDDKLVLIYNNANNLGTQVIRIGWRWES